MFTKSNAFYRTLLHVHVCHTCSRYILLRATDSSFALCLLQCFSLTSEQRQAVNDLTLTVDLINQTVGDALSDMLLVEVILCRRGWSAETWNQTYTDLPNRQLKVKVSMSSSFNHCGENI